MKALEDLLKWRRLPSESGRKSEISFGRYMMMHQFEIEKALRTLLHPSPVDTYLSDLEKGLVSISDDGVTSRKIIATIKDHAATKNMGDKK